MSICVIQAKHQMYIHQNKANRSTNKMNFLKKLFTFKWGWETTDPREIYLANSVDLVDLEQRQKQLTYGTVNPNLKGWI